MVSSGLLVRWDLLEKREIVVRRVSLDHLEKREPWVTQGLQEREACLDQQVLQGLMDLGASVAPGGQKAQGVQGDQMDQLERKE